MNTKNFFTRFCTNNSTGFDRFWRFLIPSLTNTDEFFSSFMAAAQTESNQMNKNKQKDSIISYLRKYNNKMLLTNDFHLLIYFKQIKKNDDRENKFEL